MLTSAATCFQITWSRFFSVFVEFDKCDSNACDKNLSVEKILPSWLTYKFSGNDDRWFNKLINTAANIGCITCWHEDRVEQNTRVVGIGENRGQSRLINKDNLSLSVLLSSQRLQPMRSVWVVRQPPRLIRDNVYAWNYFSRRPTTDISSVIGTLYHRVLRPYWCQHRIHELFPIVYCLGFIVDRQATRQK